MSIKKNSFTLTFLFVIILSVFKSDVVTLMYFFTLFCIEIYCLLKKDYKTIILQIFLLIPLLGITKIQVLPLSNIYFSIFGLYVLFFDKKIAHSKKILLCYFSFVFFDLFKYLFFFENITGIVNILTVPAFYLALYSSIVIFKYIAKEKKYDEYCNFFIYGTVLSILYGFITRFLSGGLIFAVVNNSILTRNSGASGDPNYFGLYIGLSIAFLIFENAKNGLRLKNYFLIFVMMFFGLSSSSRMYYIICTLLIILMVMQLLKKLFSKDFTKTIFIIIIGIVVVILLKDYFITNIEYLISRILTEGDITNGRGGLIQEYFAYTTGDFLRTLIGIGIPQYHTRAGIAHYAHNFYVEIFVTQGILGVVILIFGIIFFMLRVKKIRLYNILPFIIFLIGGIGVNYIEIDSFYSLMFLVLLFIKRSDLNEK